MGSRPLSYRVHCTYVETKVPFWRCSWVHTPDSTPEFLCTLHMCHSSNDVKLLMGIHPRLASRSPIIGLDPPQLPCTLHICSNNIKFFSWIRTPDSRHAPLLLGSDPPQLPRTLHTCKNEYTILGPNSTPLLLRALNACSNVVSCSWYTPPTRVTPLWVSTPHLLRKLHTCSIY